MIRGRGEYTVRRQNKIQPKRTSIWKFFLALSFISLGAIDMNTQTTPSSKIQFNVYRHLLSDLRQLTEDACLRRDSYLEKILENEIEILRAQKGRNTDLVRKYVYGSLRELDCQAVTITLSKELINTINEVCDEKNIHKDCFFNRILLLITYKDQKNLYETLYYADDSYHGLWKSFIEYSSDDPYERSFNYFKSGLLIIKDQVKSDSLGLIRESLVRYLEAYPDYEILYKDPLVQPINKGKVLKFRGLEVNIFGLNLILDDNQLKEIETINL